MKSAATARGGCIGRGGLRRAVLIAAVLPLIAVLQTSSPQALVQSVGHAALVAIDHPATELLEQIALEKPSFEYGLREAVAISRRPVTAPSGVALLPAPALARLFVQGPLVGRPPPVP